MKAFRIWIRKNIFAKLIIYGCMQNAKGGFRGDSYVDWYSLVYWADKWYFRLLKKDSPQ